MNAVKHNIKGSWVRGSLIILVILSFISIAPVLLMVISSVTEEGSLLEDGYSFFPKQLSLDSYRALFAQQTSIAQAYQNSALVTVLGITIHLSLTMLFAYPLSRSNFKFRRFFSFIVFFTMLFNGGVVPSYILWTRYLGVRNTFWALLLPNYLMSAFNVILCKNYLKHNIPDALTEAAEIDGAKEITVFLRIVVPLSVPILSTIGLLAGITYWNDWTNGLYYITTKKLYSIQQLLVMILNNIQFLSSGNSYMTGGYTFVFPSVSYRMAIAVVGLLPVLICMPFLQKYLVRGMVIGAIKE